MSLSVTILGCSGTWSGPDQACSGYLLRSPTTTIWMDCGPGTLAGLQRHVPLEELDGIVVSHSHPDHWVELPVTANALRYGLGLADLGLPLLCTAATADLFRAVCGYDARPTFETTVVADGATATIGDIDLTFSGTDHSVETMAVRADHGGGSIAYTADTGPGWSLASLGEGIDVALVEATLEPEQAGRVLHLTGAEAGTTAAEAGVGRLVLTHLAPGTDPEARRSEAGETYDGPLDLATADATFEA